jgi:hypothetical protein
VVRACSWLSLARGELAVAVPGVNIVARYSFEYFFLPTPASGVYRMEAVAGLSLAANVLQVVDFASKLLSTGQQIYQAGSTVQNFELEVVVKDF